MRGVRLCIRSRAPRSLGTMLVALVTLLGGCTPYGFKAGTAPSHLRTIYIPTADDQSGFGRGTLRQDVTDMLIRKFRDDNSLQVVTTADADSQLDATVTSVQDVRATLSDQSYETSREIIVQLRVVWQDNVKGGNVYARTFSARSSYSLDRGAQGESEAFEAAVDQVTTEVLNASVAMW